MKTLSMIGALAVTVLSTTMLSAGSIHMPAKQEAQAAASAAAQPETKQQDQAAQAPVDKVAPTGDLNAAIQDSHEDDDIIILEEDGEESSSSN